MSIPLINLWDKCILEIMVLGKNGAALAAFGEMAVLPGFLLPEASFGERKEGVKLGESTLKLFLGWLLDNQFPMY